MADKLPPLYLQPRTSRRLAAFLTVIHGVALGVTWFMPLIPLEAKALLSALVLVSWRYYWRLHISRVAPQAVQEIRFYEIDVSLVRTATEGVLAQLDDSSFLHPWVCVLNFRAQNGKRYSVVLLSDNVAADALRQLRVRVKFSAAK